VSEVGAGGGSIVRVDAGGALKVGPQSAGAVPGPACYAKGGTEPTVTDASVVLGYLNPDALAGGTVPIEGARSHRVLAQMAEQIGGNVLDLAHGIHRLANATMMRAVKAVSTYRGRDPRDFTLFAFGGNGGIHAAALAEELGMTRVIVPPGAGVFSAIGLLCADHEAVRSVAYLRPLDVQSVAGVASRCRALELQALEELSTRDDVTIRWRADLRYAGQGFELLVDLDANSDAGEIRRRFEQEYRRTYGHELENAAIEFVALRVVASVAPDRAVDRFRMRRRAGNTARSRSAYFGKQRGLHETPVIARGDLTSTPRSGPLIIEEYEGTTVVPPHASAALDACDNIVITFAEGRPRG